MKRPPTSLNSESLIRGRGCRAESVPVVSFRREKLESGKLTLGRFPLLSFLLYFFFFSFRNLFWLGGTIWDPGRLNHGPPQVSLAGQMPQCLCHHSGPWISFLKSWVNYIQNAILKFMNSTGLDNLVGLE